LDTPRGRILCIEDDGDTCSLLSTLLGLSHYQVVTARTMAEALASAQSGPFDLYLLDSKLPDGTGAELCQQIRAFNRHTPIIFLSGAASQADRKQAVSAGAQAFLPKPADLEALRQVIARLLGSQKKISEILLVEDNPADVNLMRLALEEGKEATNLNTVEDGEEALVFLRQQGKYASVKRPDLIILDLHLPKRDGYEVLTEIKRDPHLKHIPVVVLTISSAPEQIRKAFDLGANSCITKPVELEQLFKIVKSLEEFWLL
jgi:two-component system, chemotaxis family, response regulator Rcp1